MSPRVETILRAGMAAGMVHARTGFSALGWAVALRDAARRKEKGERRTTLIAMQENACAGMVDVAHVANALACEAERLDYGLMLERVEKHYGRAA